MKLAYEALGLGSGEFADMAGISRSTLLRLETGKGVPTIKTLTGTERAIGWPMGTLRAIADGADAPEPTDTRVLTITRPPGLDDPGVLDRLPEEIRQELEAGDIYGVDVATIGRNASGARVVTIALFDRANATPEELKELRDQWQEHRKLLRHPPADG